MQQLNIEITYTDIFDRAELQPSDVHSLVHLQNGNNPTANDTGKIYQKSHQSQAACSDSDTLVQSSRQRVKRYSARNPLLLLFVH
jgi:hypothetical protein